MNAVLKNISFYMFLGTILAACGPEDSARDKQIEQIQNNARKTRAELQLAEGDYQGIMISTDGVQFDTILEVRVISRVDTSRGIPVELPTLVGLLKSRYLSRPDMKYDVVNYSEGLFSKSGSFLQLSGTFLNNKVSLEATLHDNVLKGQAILPNTINSFELEKVIE